MAWHLAVVVISGGLGLPRALAYLTALFGSEYYSQRAMQLLRRPPLRR